MGIKGKTRHKYNKYKWFYMKWAVNIKYKRSGTVFFYCYSGGQNDKCKGNYVFNLINNIVA